VLLDEDVLRGFERRWGRVAVVELALWVGHLPHSARHVQRSIQGMLEERRKYREFRVDLSASA
jgi:hypothetical protein